MMTSEKMAVVQMVLPFVALIVSVAIGGWVVTTWLRIRNGYPLDGQWGQALYPKRNEETVERVTLLTQENGQLRAELGAVKDRLANVERIVTDGAYSLTHDIERLRDGRPAN